ncbi:MAG: hypothetical protein ACK40G_01105 [Cytophagaceae bacterium]
MKHYLLFILILFSSCKSDFTSEKQMHAWINNPENGIIKSKTIGDLSYTIKYLPPEFLAFNELKRSEKTSQAYIDSLILYYNGSLTFLLTIEVKDAPNGNSPLTMNINNYAEYKDRIEKLNFELDDFLTLVVNEKNFKPLVWTLENTYNIGNKSNLFIVFGDNVNGENLLNNQNLELVFNDELFMTGINKFNFDTEKMKNIPSIKFWQTLKN